MSDHENTFDRSSTGRWVSVSVTCAINSSLDHNFPCALASTASSVDCWLGLHLSATALGQMVVKRWQNEWTTCSWAAVCALHRLVSTAGRLCGDVHEKARKSGLGLSETNSVASHLDSDAALHKSVRLCTCQCLRSHFTAAFLLFLESVFTFFFSKNYYCFRHICLFDFFLFKTF